MNISNPDSNESFEKIFREKGFTKIAGIDEVGRGPLAGPVVASCVVLPVGFSSPRIRDSKQLSPKARLAAYWEILQVARVGIGIVSQEIIDQINILRASLLAMKKAVLSLALTPDVLLIDGTYRIEKVPVEQMPIVSGDRKSISISAASIVAKVTRDKLMEVYDEKFPGYGFAKHKGYPSPEHLDLLQRFGPSPIHRMSFGPVVKAKYSAS